LAVKALKRRVKKAVRVREWMVKSLINRREPRVFLRFSVDFDKIRDQTTLFPPERCCG
jgi:hypothetical protein